MTPEEYLPITEEDWEASDSKFAVVGVHVSEMGMPSWKTPNVSYQFPFIITEGEDKGKEGILYASMKKFSLDPIFKACGISYEFKGGKLVFDKEAFVGKPFQSVWTTRTDTRLVSEGGTGRTYTMPTGALPVGARIEELIPDDLPL